MSANAPQLDKYGFPIPATFDPPRPTRPRRRVPPGMALLIVLVVGGAMAILGTRRFWAAQLNDSVAEYYERRGRERQMLDDLPGALADLDAAARWAPDRLSVYFARSIVRLELHDVPGCLSDCDRVLRVNEVPLAYQVRSQAHQRLGRHDEAIADATRYVELSAGQDPNPWNTRAYVRALARRELEEALRDVERAIELGGALSAYLDTRGYLLFLLGEHSRALADLDEAVAQAEQEKHAVLASARQRNLATGAVRRFERSANESLSVLYHHRAEIRQALGRQAEAKVDFQAAEQLGYNPAKGVM